MSVRYLSSGLWPLTTDGTNVTLESGQILLTTNSVTTPALAHAGDANTGIDFVSNDRLGIVANGAWQIIVDSTKTLLRTAQPLVFASGTSLATDRVGIMDNADGVLEVNNGTGGTFRDLIARTYRSRGTNGQESQITTASALVSALSGATGTASNLIPAGALLFGVTARVTTLITGATSFDVGDEALEDKWGDGIAVAADTTTTLADVNVVTPTVYTVATDVVLTARGGDFTAGAVRVTAHYMTLVAATS